LGWTFLRHHDVLRIHARVIQLFGGGEGIRDEGALSSALTAAENRVHYENPDLAACAATYAYHLTQAHAFVDGNKRVAAAVTEVFLGINEAQLIATNEQVVSLFLNIAAGGFSREQVEDLFRSWIVTARDKT
jgi:death-on-curing protein